MTEAAAKRPPPMPGFPELSDAAVAWSPSPGPGPEQVMRHTAGSWQAVLPCGNPACRGGGFDLGSVVEGMLSSREAEKTGLLVCEGWEGGPPDDPAAAIPCVRAIRYRITLAYRKGAPPMLPDAPRGDSPLERGGPPRDGG